MNKFYPATNCHFCQAIILYARYVNGDNHAYCVNNCMEIIYNIDDGPINIKEFIIESKPNLILKAQIIDDQKSLIIYNYNGNNKTIDIDFDMSIVLNKNKLDKLLEQVEKLNINI